MDSGGDRSIMGRKGRSFPEYVPVPVRTNIVLLHDRKGPV